MEEAESLNAAIIVAGGVGARARQADMADLPKQYQMLAGQAVIAHTLQAFLSSPHINVVQPVIAAGAEEIYEQATAHLDRKKLRAPVAGGATRQHSVSNGLQALQNRDISRVLVHDAARPFATNRVIENVVTALGEHNAVIAAIPVTSTLKKVSQDTGIITGTIDRDGVWQAQTPQGFDYEELRRLHETYHDLELTDDAALFEHDGQSVAICQGDAHNIKITLPEDFDLAESIIRMTRTYEFRTGQGFDVHRFESGDGVTLCGVTIPHNRRLKGHSDADVAMHALTDAILGAIGAGDIGFHFPPSDPQWRGAPSQLFLEKACDLVHARQGQLTHCDLTIICEQPKVNPHRDEMRVKLAEIMNCAVDRVSVKATTTEKLGFTGREEGISALATATVKLPTETQT
ncbi:MAG: bifunctional 2-C-methyl-D-erythritol 4-phosphate cytidylyltransferase/2-C-methyl-D-erythritol 2,4-cyclodiphosphate synthase [Aquisalinus sp.]|nr:bifunctional 2-C-methyl-D-erythritol 4-phosphate cytidylyltransferase/2-C-methyl-D-erythritol 2,4-cyclodiphosphate synthase [Aquisalinus sp.]